MDTLTPTSAPLQLQQLQQPQLPTRSRADLRVTYIPDTVPSTNPHTRHSTITAITTNSSSTMGTTTSTTQRGEGGKLQPDHLLLLRRPRPPQSLRHLLLPLPPRPPPLLRPRHLLREAGRTEHKGTSNYSTVSAASDFSTITFWWPIERSVGVNRSRAWAPRSGRRRRRPSTSGNPHSSRKVKGCDRLRSVPTGRGFRPWTVDARSIGKTVVAQADRASDTSTVGVRVPS